LLGVEVCDVLAISTTRTNKRGRDTSMIYTKKNKSVVLVMSFVMGERACVGGILWNIGGADVREREEVRWRKGIGMCRNV